MPSFDDFFTKSKGKSIEYNGLRLEIADEFPVKNGDTLICSIEKTNSKYRQGFCIDITGYCEIDRKIFKQGKGIRMFFWEDTAPKKIELKIFTNKKSVFIYNICERQVTYLLSDKNEIPVSKHSNTIDYGHNGAAMIAEEIENGKRYRCSDISSEAKEFPFNNIVFTIQNLKKYNAEL